MNDALWEKGMEQEMVRADTGEQDKVYCMEVLEDSIMKCEF